MSWLMIGSWSIVSITLALIALGAGITIVYGIVRLMLGCLRLTPWLLALAWAKLTGRPPTTFGSARFACGSELDDLKGSGGVMLGQLPDGTGLSAGQNHVLVLGPTGSRKSRSVMMPTADRWEGALVALDVKGELATEGAAIRQ